ncbi:MAG: trypsin-like peptidase domain-containing protein [Phycisphaerae bacterium]
MSIGWVLPAAGQSASQAPAVGALGRAIRRTPVVEVFERTRDAVVNIQATQTVERVIPFSPFDDFFFGDLGGRTQQFTTTSLGSGFVIHPDGYVVTNAHVVSHSGVKVTFADKTEYDADRVAVDERHDLAVLKIRAQRVFPAVTLGRSDDLMIGETVIAIGNPLGYEHTVTAGIISATNRTLEVTREVSYTGLIQTDASINRGNSGGPLLNVLGELIGINTAIRGDAQNIGFAIPVDTLRTLLPEMLSIERTRRLQVGLRLRWADRLYVAESYGPAAAAGVRAGDELVSVNNVPMRQDVDYYIYLWRIRPKDRLTFELRRGGRHVTAVVTPATIPNPDGARLLREKFGLSVRPLTSQEARELRLNAGLAITAVEPESPADRAGLVRGLVIVQIGKFFPTDVDDVGKLLENVAAGDKVLIRVWEPRGSLIRVLEGYLVAR